MIIEASVNIDPARAEAWAAVLAERGDARWSVFEDVLAKQAWIRGVFLSQAEAGEEWRLLWASAPAGLRRGCTVETRELPDADWRESYKAHFKAWRCGRLHWVPEWERESHAVPRGHTAVYLDPGLAFGTGNHETTRLCVQEMLAFARSRGAAGGGPGSIIDAGCGSGILAISAAKLGFARVFAFDVDAEAVAIARSNARRNGVSSRVRFATAGLGEALARRSADLVLANIQADVLVTHAKDLVHAVRPGGWLVLSGVLAPEAGRVAQVFRREAGGGRLQGRQLGEWASLRVVPSSARTGTHARSRA